MASARGHGITVKDVAAHDFIPAYAQLLKRSGKIEVPKWADIVKTGAFKELAPYDQDWYYVRCAAVARHIYLRGGVGVGALRKVYGGSKNRGACPSRFALSSGSVARSVLQSLESIKVLEKDPEGGRRITRTGRKELDQVALQVAEA
eukprot:m.476428 g.476428  ORF g.476428 m.476428 type:complete len:147 (+) comp20528_c0_seq1:50-490(+)